jgi:LuxR family maltose regulon positive regulatory protein
MNALIQSKLAPPPPAAYCVERTALLEQLTRLPLKRLSVIAAPSGFGKSTLLSDWYARIHTPAITAGTRNRLAHIQRMTRASADPRIAWLTLDPPDNEPARFFGYLIGAIRHVAHEFDPAIEQFGSASFADATHTRATIDAAAAEILAALSRLNAELTVVLDDFQWLRDECLARAFGFIVWRSPSHVRWIVSGRCLPDLPLSQFRLHDQLHVIDQRQLSFDSAAIVQLCQKLRGVMLSPEQAEQLRVRTEGWVAGLKLTLLASESADSPAVATSASLAVASPPHDVARYIDATVLDELDSETREFLIVTAIVERFNAELCNSLLGITHSQAILDRLERMQLFVIPLDMEHRWYRFHTLFGEYLRARLSRDYSAKLGALHLAASRWYAEQQAFADALVHAFASEDRTAALTLFSKCARSLQKNGDIGTILRWTAKLTRTEILETESIAVAQIASLIFCRRFSEAAALLSELESNRATCPRFATLRLMLNVLSDVDGDSTAESVSSEDNDAYLTGTLMTLQAYQLIRRNRFDAARRRASRARELLHEQGARYGAMYADILVCMANRAVGNMDLVAQQCERMFADAQAHKHDSTWVAAATSMALLRYEQNRSAESEALCIEILPLLSNASTVENFVSPYIMLARTKASTGRHAEAADLLDYLHGVLESTRQNYFLSYVCFEKIRLNLAIGRHDRARAVAKEFQLTELAAQGTWSAPREFDCSWERFGMSHAAMLLNARQHAECRITLQTLIDSARGAGNVYRVAPLFGMLAACEWHAGNRQAAFDALNVGLGFMQQTGFTRTAFDESPLLREVLSAAINTRQLLHPLPARFLEKFKGMFPAAHPAARASASRTSIPLEALTDREANLLSLLAEGLSNQEISERSQIALSTTKWHLKNVFSKLHVTTRTGALAKARELQLIQ